MIILQRTKWIGFVIAAVIVAVLCVFGVLRLIERNEQLRLLQEQSTITEIDKPEKQPPQATQTPTPTEAPSQAVTQYPSTLKPSPDPPVESPEIPEDIEYPGGQDLDDYGDWLPPYEPPETEPAPVYRNETITIPTE